MCAVLAHSPPLFDVSNASFVATNPRRVPKNCVRIASHRLKRRLRAVMLLVNRKPAFDFPIHMPDYADLEIDMTPKTRSAIVRAVCVNRGSQYSGE